MVLRGSCVRASAIVALLSISGLPVLAQTDNIEVRQLIRGLSDGDSATREGSAIAIAKRGAEARTAAPYLAALIADPDPNVRTAAADALGDVYAAGDVVSGLVISALVKGLADPSRSVKESSLRTLEKLGKAGRPASSALAGLTRSDDWDIRYAAIKTLGVVNSDPGLPHGPGSSATGGDNARVPRCLTDLLECCQ